jgi:hypothetical protein
VAHQTDLPGRFFGQDGVGTPDQSSGTLARLTVPNDQLIELNDSLLSLC